MDYPFANKGTITDADTYTLLGYPGAGFRMVFAADCIIIHNADTVATRITFAKYLDPDYVDVYVSPSIAAGETWVCPKTFVLVGDEALAAKLSVDYTTDPPDYAISYMYSGDDFSWDYW